MGNIYDALIDLGYEDDFDPYEGISKEELELYNSVPTCSSMTSTGWDVDVDENGPFIVTDDVSTEIDLGRDVPDEIWEPEYLGDR